MSLYVDKASSQLHSRLRSFFQCSNASYTIQKMEKKNKQKNKKNKKNADISVADSK